MTAQELKNSILQLAVQGKLVTQNKSDISVDLSGLKQKKVNECEFDIPNSWRLAHMATITLGVPSKQYQILESEVKQIGRFPVISQSKAYSIGFTNCEEKLYHHEDPVVIFGDHTTEIKFVDFDFVVGADGVKIFEPITSVITAKFLFYVLQFYSRDLHKVGGYSRHYKFIKDNPIPLPPLAEQERIVAKIEELMPLVAKYDEAEQKLSTLNADFSEMLRKSILQQAVQGKLTARDASDEPASELLNRIRAEKAKLVIEGKGKADKPYAPITDDELPFDLPDGWAAVRIGELGFYRKGPFGSSLTKQMFVPKGPNSVKVYEQKNAIQKDWQLGDYYITRDYFESKMRGFEVFPGDIVVSCAGTIGESYVMPDGCEQGIINQALMRMKIVDAMNLDYFLLYFDYVLKASAQKNCKGAAIKNIPPFEILKNMIMPLPPVEEQKRIVERVNELLAVCDGLK